MRVRPPDPAALAEAAQLLRDGKLVVFPTETVYGLGANALDAAAVRRVYEAKGRPADNPLIVHCLNAGAARTLAARWPEGASRLAAAFWPGPLTLVVARAAGALPAVAPDLPTLAVRVPGHPVARALLEASGVPIAAPSANRSGSPSPTRVADAVEDLGKSVALYLDGGPCVVGLESTVVRVDGPPELLRLGGIPREAIEAIVGPLSFPRHGPVVSPGMKYRHYAPRAKVVVAPPGELQAWWGKPGTGFVVSTESGLAGPHAVVPGSRGDGKAWAHALFSALRDLDAAGCTVIVVEEIPSLGLGAAVMDRVRRASQ
ncbi:MAG: L-threonylcarbamoyladenylate synthase [Thermoplasmatota archaeon]